MNNECEVFLMLERASDNRASEALRHVIRRSCYRARERAPAIEVSELFTDRQARQATSHDLPELDCTLQSGARIIDDLDRVSLCAVNRAELADHDHILESVLSPLLAIIGIVLGIPARIELPVDLDAFIYRNIRAEPFTYKSMITPA